jgi:hypothetical protein
MLKKTCIKRQKTSRRKLNKLLTILKYKGHRELHCGKCEQGRKIKKEKIKKDTIPTIEDFNQFTANG